MSEANLQKKFTSLFDPSKNNEPLPKKIAAISTAIKSTPTIIARDIKIEGQIESSGVVEIEGFIKGSAKGNLIAIRETGSFNGDIIADTITISGEFEGNINAKSVNISNKAKVIGKIEYSTLFVEDGAYIDGQFKCVGERKKK